jgi:putative PIN family toxin of toxin-antitoxin system
MANKFVIDTNVLVSALSSKSVYHSLIQDILNQRINIYVTDEILLEYEEILKLKYSATVATNFIKALHELPNVFMVNVYYKWNLLNDKDDNKFIDCYVAANASILISNDKGFNILKQVEFPVIYVITIEQYFN